MFVVASTMSETNSWEKPFYIRNSNRNLHAKFLKPNLQNSQSYVKTMHPNRLWGCANWLCGATTMPKVAQNASIVPFFFVVLFLTFLIMKIQRGPFTNSLAVYMYAMWVCQMTCSPRFYDYVCFCVCSSLCHKNFFYG